MTIRSTKEKGGRMWMWIGVVMFTVYVIARKKNWGISEWLEIILAAIFLFLFFHI